MASDVEQKLLRLTDRVKDVETEELVRFHIFCANKLPYKQYCFTWGFLLFFK